MADFGSADHTASRVGSMQSTSKLSVKKRTAAPKTVTLLSPAHCPRPALSVGRHLLRHTKFLDFHHRHHTARIDSPADIGATWVADGGS
jgi:hypothetical protein